MLRRRPPTTSPSAVDYARVVAEVERVLASGHVELLERLAFRSPARPSPSTTGARRPTSRCASLRPPVPQDLATAGARIRRTR